MEERSDFGRGPAIQMVEHHLLQDCPACGVYDKMIATACANVLTRFIMACVNNLATHFQNQKPADPRIDSVSVSLKSA